MRLLLEKDFRFLVQAGGIVAQKPAPNRRSIVFRVDQRRRARCVSCHREFETIYATKRYCSRQCVERERHKRYGRKRRTEKSLCTANRLQHELGVVRAKYKALQIKYYSRKQVVELTDSYLRAQLKGNSELKPEDFPDELVELKRQQLRLTRAINGSSLENSLVTLKHNYMELKKSLKLRRSNPQLAELHRRYLRIKRAVKSGKEVNECTQAK